MGLKALVLFILPVVLAVAGCGSSDSSTRSVAMDTGFNAPLGYTLFSAGSGFSSRGVEVALQSDGRIIVMGSAVNGADDDLLLVRYTTAGQLDTSFGTNGFVRYGDFDRDRGLGLAIIPADDAIIVTGYATINGSRELLVLKFSSSGVLMKELLYSDLGTDIGFGITITPDQKIVVIGESSSSQSKKQDLLLLRMDFDLQLDPTFGRQGAVHYNGPANDNEKGFAVAAQPDGKLVASGAVISNGSKEDMLVIRINQDGSLDSSFGVNGSFIWSGAGDYADYANNLALQPDGKIMVTGAAASATGFQITTMRLLSSGQLDSGFGQNGLVTYTGLTGSDAYPYGLLLQLDGKIVVAGSSMNSAGNKDAVMLRYTAAGQLDPLFGKAGLLVFEGPGGGTDVANGLALQPDQALLVTGYTTNGQYDSVLTWRLK
jgi:uncharacterized delta-60 repeat protein